MTAAERVEAVNSARHTLVQAVTGLVVIGGVVFTALGLWYTAQTLNTTQEGQITDRYTKAVGQLGSTKSDVRLGGIYALQRLAADSTRDRDTIRNVLSAFVRNHDGCTLQPGEKTPPKRCSDGNGRMSAPLVRPPADVVAALTIAPTLTANNSVDLTGHADFSHSRFPRADLTGADLTNANLNFANLTGANLTGANLTGANLTGADLSRARLAGANLNDSLIVTDVTVEGRIVAELSAAGVTVTRLTVADLTEAHLTRAKLTGAFLTGANLTDANLTDADLSRADLTEANLKGATLYSADLRGVRGITEQQVRAVAKVDSNTKFGPMPG
ncbi:pentapeptide repeat-containing protein [Nonomuraea sp. K274]|uniref:Pentapeptide repeat-containing protein n=1 Tax=Nonomuraea cypriaca TaxID=1187855 RepID=A0A931ANI4_9ACTN|nr:pentapeptide repeat-containing protein [Nonomuraea cypriaca]MBF8193848.1 pentapeptide repeat-containing protein [Nonomuraea cypriaca]